MRIIIRLNYVYSSVFVINLVFLLLGLGHSQLNGKTRLHYILIYKNAVCEHSQHVLHNYK